MASVRPRSRTGRDSRSRQSDSARLGPLPEHVMRLQSSPSVTDAGREAIHRAVGACGCRGGASVTRSRRPRPLARRDAVVRAGADVAPAFRGRAGARGLRRVASARRPERAPQARLPRRSQARECEHGQRDARLLASSHGPPDEPSACGEDQESGAAGAGGLLLRQLGHGALSLSRRPRIAPCHRDGSPGGAYGTPRSPAAPKPHRLQGRR